MYNKIFIPLLLFLPLLSFAQTDYKKIVGGLKKIDNSELISDHPVFLEVVSHGLDIVPFLIEETANYRKTKVETVFFHGKHAVGDIALMAINRIVSLPLFQLAGVLPGKESYYYAPVWQELHKAKLNRTGFRDELRRWFGENRETLELSDDDGKYHALPQDPYEPCEEDIIVDLLLHDVDRLSRVKYLEIERSVYFSDSYLSPHEWERNSYPMDPDTEETLNRILPEIKEYYEANKEKDQWCPDAPVLQQRRFSKFKIIPAKDYSYYMFGTETIPAGTIYRISKPLYDKTGNYALVTLGWLPAMGGHGAGSTNYILYKTSSGRWQVYKVGTRIIS